MKLPLPFLAIAALLSHWALGVGQTVPNDSTASISGRVTIAGKAAAGVTVVAATSGPFGKRIAGKATTDQDGNYLITGLSPGRLTVAPMARAYVRFSTSGSTDHSSRPLNVSAGDEITKIDFTLIRGGVITGRITDTDGSPVISENVTILPVDTPGTGTQPTILSSKAHTTDDRGIYRIYGLVPGTYKVSVGQSRPEQPNAFYRNGSQYVQTFYPGVSEEAKATLIELKEGSEVNDIDIRTSKGAKGFSVSGRVVDASSNQPAANVYIGYSVVEDSKDGQGGMSFSPVATDVNGKFTIEGLQPGRYNAFTMSVGLENTSYSEPAKFEVRDGDVSGIEIKLSRGITLGGVAVIENSQDPAVAAILQTVNLYAFGDRKSSAAPSFARSTIKADGSFKFTGLAPGKIRIQMMGFPTPPKGLTLARVELGGVEQRSGIEAGTDLNDIRLVFTYGGGSLRGTLNVAGGIPEGVNFVVLLNTSNAPESSLRRSIDVDSRGHFIAEDVPAGTYELTIYAKVGVKDAPDFSPIKQSVTIINGNETKISIDIDLTRKRGSN